MKEATDLLKAGKQLIKLRFYTNIQRKLSIKNIALKDQKDQVTHTCTSGMQEHKIIIIIAYISLTYTPIIKQDAAKRVSIKGEKNNISFLRERNDSHTAIHIHLLQLLVVKFHSFFCIAKYHPFHFRKHSQYIDGM